MPAKENETNDEAKLTNLLDKVALPQVHALYRFNVATGVVVSNVRRPIFSTVKSEVDPDSGKPIYSTVETRGDRPVQAVAMLGVYLRRVDIQNRVSAKDVLIPALTVGFSLTSPADNVYVGLKHETVRNVQLAYGLHFARATRLGPSDVDAGSPKPSDAPRPSPATYTAFVKPGGYIGVTINVTFITNIFK